MVNKKQHIFKKYKLIHEWKGKSDIDPPNNQHQLNK